MQTEFQKLTFEDFKQYVFNLAQQGLSRSKVITTISETYEVNSKVVYNILKLLGPDIDKTFKMFDGNLPTFDERVKPYLIRNKERDERDQVNIDSLSDNELIELLIERQKSKDVVQDKVESIQAQIDEIGDINTIRDEVKTLYSTYKILRNE